MNHMDWRGYLLALLSVSLCVFGLKKCLNGFRRTRGSGTLKPYIYALGIALLLGIIALVLLVLLFEFLGPFH
jgi:uncharacterized membrane protein YidH (DUF202 family)